MAGLVKAGGMVDPVAADGLVDLVDLVGTVGGMAGRGVAGHGGGQITGGGVSGPVMVGPWVMDGQPVVIGCAVIGGLLAGVGMAGVDVVEVGMVEVGMAGVGVGAGSGGRECCWIGVVAAVDRGGGVSVGRVSFIDRVSVDGAAVGFGAVGAGWVILSGVHAGGSSGVVMSARPEDEYPCHQDRRSAYP